MKLGSLTAPYVRHVAHAQAKDIEILGSAINRYRWPGIAINRPDPWKVGYRVPGLGQVDWRRVVDTLYEGGFDGVLSVEHEAPVWGGTEEKIFAGLEVAPNPRTADHPLTVRHRTGEVA